MCPYPSQGPGKDWSGTLCHLLSLSWKTGGGVALTVGPGKAREALNPGGQAGLRMGHGVGPRTGKAVTRLLKEQVDPRPLLHWLKEDWRSQVALGRQGQETLGSGAQAQPRAPAREEQGDGRAGTP